MEPMENTETSLPGANPETPATSSDNEAYTPVTLTQKAVDMIKITRDQEGIDASHGLRIAVRGGGCSGFEYALDFEKEPRENDWVYEQAGVTVFVDAVSARYLEGTSIDYVLGSTGAGFKFNNPKATGTCGCGSSFTV